MVAHLQKIAQIEAIDINLEALTLVAQIANGGLRDAESLLDQLSLLAGTITAERVWDLVGAVPERDLLTLLKVIHSNIPDQVIEQCRHLMNRGKEPLIVLQNLAGFYLNLLLAKTAPNRPEMVAVTAPTWQDLCTEARTWSLEEILRGQQLLKDSETQLKNTTQPRLIGSHYRCGLDVGFRFLYWFRHCLTSFPSQNHGRHGYGFQRRGLGG